MSIHTSKKGLIVHSDMTNKYYLVKKWKDHGNGSIEALIKEEISEDKITKDETGKYVLK